MNNKKLYEEEILNTKIETNEDEKLVNDRYEKLNGIMESMYDFILAYSNYYSIRRDYGTGEKFTMIEIHILSKAINSSIVNFFNSFFFVFTISRLSYFL